MVLIHGSHAWSSQARDLVESPTKPGAASLGVLTAVAPLIRQLGPKADPANLKRVPIAAAAVWALYAGECVCVLVKEFVSTYCKCSVYKSECTFKFCCHYARS